MATLTDVYNALIALAVNAVYPNGASQPSIANADVIVRPGWPDPDQLDTVLAQSKVRVSIFKMPGMEKNKSNNANSWEPLSVPDATLSLVTTAATVTVNGTVTVPQNCMISVNGVSYHYAVQSDDTLNSIAANLAALIPGAVANDNVITITDAYSIVARVGVLGSAIREVKRQEQSFRIVTWAPTPELRDIVSDAIDILFGQTVRIQLTNSELECLIYKGSQEHDEFQKVNLYRRDLIYSIEYATTQVANFYQIVDTQDSISYEQSIN